MSAVHNLEDQENARSNDAETMRHCPAWGGPAMDCDRRFTGLENRMDKVENRLDKVEQRLDKVEQRLDKVEQRLDHMDQRLDIMDQRLGRVETGLDKLRDTVEGLRWWIVGSLLAGIAIVTAFAAYQATWVQTYVDKSEATNRALLIEMDKRWQGINAEQQKRHDEQMQALGQRIGRLEKNGE